MTGIGPGRPPKVHFPIKRILVDSGQAFTKTMNENTTVSCLRCGGQFLVNGDTAYRTRQNKLDDMPYVRCPICGYKAAVIYYFDRVVKGDENVRKSRQCTDQPG